MKKNYLRPNKAAKYMQLSMSTLAKMRMRGDGPAYTKAGQKMVLYELADLNVWLEERERVSTAQNKQFDS